MAELPSGYPMRLVQGVVLRSQQQSVVAAWWPPIRFLGNGGMASATATSNLSNGGPALATAIGGNGGAPTIGGAATAIASATNGGPAVADSDRWRRGEYQSRATVQRQWWLASATATSTAMLGGLQTQPQQRRAAL